jgi:hypothetical protein
MTETGVRSVFPRHARDVARGDAAADTVVVGPGCAGASAMANRVPAHGYASDISLGDGTFFWRRAGLRAARSS